MSLPHWRYLPFRWRIPAELLNTFMCVGILARTTCRADLNSACRSIHNDTPKLFAGTNLPPVLKMLPSMMWLLPPCSLSRGVAKPKEFQAADEKTARATGRRVLAHRVPTTTQGEPRYTTYR